MRNVFYRRWLRVGNVDNATVFVCVPCTPAAWCCSDCHVSPGPLSLEDRSIVLYCLSNCLLSTDLRASCCYQHTIHVRSFVANEEVLEIPSLAILLVALLVGALL